MAITQYKAVLARNAVDLTKFTNELIGESWQPYGAVLSDDDLFVQIMIKGNPLENGGVPPTSIGDISDFGTFGASFAKKDTAAEAKTALAIAPADIVGAATAGKAILTTETYATVLANLAPGANDLTDAGTTGKALVRAEDEPTALTALGLGVMANVADPESDSGADLETTLKALLAELEAKGFMLSAS